MKSSNNKIIIFILIISGLFYGCTKRTSNNELVCSPVTGLEPLLINKKIILLGEMHGTKEGPGFVEKIVCHALGKKLSVSVGLELPYLDEQVIKTFMKSKGKASDRAKILNLPFWSQDYQDGRASNAMLGLIASLRALRVDGADVEIFLIDDPSSSDRDIEMAQRVIQKATEKPSNFLIVLTGNYHNMINKGSGQMGRYVLDKFEESKVISLNQNFSGGTAWIDTTGNGAKRTKLSGRGRNQIGIFIDKSRDEYHGTFEVDSIHYSEPAKNIIDK